MSNCVYAGQEYSEGAEVCHETRVMKCVSGAWIDTGRSCEANEESELEVTSTIARRVAPSQCTFCCRFFNIGQVTRVGLRNTCTECKVAVINFNLFNGKHEIRKFKVPGKSDIEVDTSKSQLTEIIDEETC